MFFIDLNQYMVEYCSAITPQTTIRHTLIQIMRYFFALFLICVSISAQQTSQMTPYKPVELMPKTIDRMAKYGSVFPQNAQVNVPEGFTVSIFYAGNPLQKPRFMTWGPNDVLHIADLNAKAIFALPDMNNDGVADTILTVASNVIAHDIAFYRGDLYAAQERSVIKLRDLNNDGFYETQSDVIAPIAEGAAQPGGGHTTRTILIDSLRGKIYLSIGSRCNVCRTDDPNDQDYQRALVEEWNLDGTGRRTFATGIRNAVGLLERGGRIWASNNGSDNQGNNIPPEWIDVLRDNGFYGYPFAHSQGIFFPISNASPSDYKSLLPFTAIDSAKVKSMVQPAGLIQAHSAPMALVSAHTNMPEGYRNGVFVALRGSWNRTPATGGKIIYLDFDDLEDTTANFTSDFLTGFMTDSTKSSNWGWARPVGLAIDKQGRMFVGSDANTRFILMISPQKSTSIQQSTNQRLFTMNCTELGELQVRWNIPNDDIHRFTIHDIQGNEIAIFNGSEITMQGILTMADLSQGMYFLHAMLKDGLHFTASSIIMK